MLSAVQILEVKSHLNRLTKYKKVAEATGVSRQTVRRIAAGGLDYRLEPKPVRFDNVEPSREKPPTKPERCPSCRAMVYMPCLKCTIDQSPARNPEVCNIEIPSESDMARALTALKATVEETHYTLTTVAEQLVSLEAAADHNAQLKIPGNTRKLESFNLRRLMAKHNMTTERLVALTGVDERTIRGIRNGTAKPHGRTINKLAKGLGVDVDEFYRVANVSQEIAMRKPR